MGEGKIVKFPGEDDATEKVVARSLATRKFDLLKIVNADPLCTPAALKVLLAYLPFLKDFRKPVYRSTSDLMIDTGLSNRGVFNARDRLVELGYLARLGKTKEGTFKFHVGFARENLVLDHVLIARETHRETDAVRKARQRKKRRRVSEHSSRTDNLRECTRFTDVSELSSPEYLDEDLDVASIEGRNNTQGVSSETQDEGSFTPASPLNRPTDDNWNSLGSSIPLQNGSPEKNGSPEARRSTRC